MLEPNIINKIKNFAENNGYEFEPSEPPNEFNPSVLIFGETHEDKEREMLEKLIKELGLPKFILLTEVIQYWEKKFAFAKPCDLDLYINPNASDCDREKEMGETILRNLRDFQKPIVVIIGHLHAAPKSEVHKILGNKKIDHTCMWSEKAVKDAITIKKQKELLMKKPGCVAH